MWVSHTPCDRWTLNVLSCDVKSVKQTNSGFFIKSQMVKKFNKSQMVKLILEQERGTHAGIWTHGDQCNCSKVNMPTAIKESKMMIEFCNNYFNRDKDYIWDKDLLNWWIHKVLVFSSMKSLAGVQPYVFWHENISNMGKLNILYEESEKIRNNIAPILHVQYFANTQL